MTQLLTGEMSKETDTLGLSTYFPIDLFSTGVNQSFITLTCSKRGAEKSALQCELRSLGMLFERGTPEIPR